MRGPRGVAESFGGPIHAVLSDVKMPRLDGPGMVERLRDALLSERMSNLLARAMSA